MADRIINANILRSKPKINFSANNIITSVEVDESTNYFFNESIFNEHFSIYNSKNGKYSYDINNYNNEIMNNNLKPFIESINFISEGYKYNYLYYKINLKLDKMHLGQRLNLDIIQSGTDEILNVGIQKLEYKANLNIGTNGMRKFLKYNSISNFEQDWFNFVSIPPYLPRIESVKKPAGYLTCGIVLGDNSADILILLEKYELNSFGSYYRIQQAYDLNIRLDLMSTKTAVFKSSQGNIKSDYVLNSNELMQTDTTINGISIGQYIANNIIEQYKNGKATMTCSVNISDGTPLFVVGEIAKVYGFDGKSFSRNRDGTDKRFKITSAEWRWAGQSTQNLEMVEVIE